MNLVGDYWLFKNTTMIKKDLEKIGKERMENAAKLGYPYSLDYKAGYAAAISDICDVLDVYQDNHSDDEYEGISW